MRWNLVQSAWKKASLWNRVKQHWLDYDPQQLLLISVGNFPTLLLELRVEMYRRKYLEREEIVVIITILFRFQLIFFVLLDNYYIDFALIERFFFYSYS